MRGQGGSGERTGGGEEEGEKEEREGGEGVKGG